MTNIESLALWVPLAPLAGALIAGLFGRAIGRSGAHVVTILGVLTAFVLSCLIAQDVFAGAHLDKTLYVWLVSGSVKFEVGFLIDTLTTTMMLVVTFVSLMVHIYTIGYMHDDPGYQRFFSYISLFTFAMLMLVMSNNFMQLFFGWEAVGLVSYLLIGFWYTRPTAIFANMKAFLVNRVGDFGFILGIGLILAYTGSMNYAEVFAKSGDLATKFINLGFGDWALLSVACICLFIGAMGKSAQVPLHVWLPDSMEGPTPISALIHAATMVTAGIFMVSRMSPLFELSPTALSFVMVIGATTALFMGFLGIIQNDIKRVVAYSTLSQLGYMTVALGASAYSAAIFHLMTHAFFKALLFLGAGSVIIGMHHNQDIRYMGGLWKKMPITWITSLIGSLALIGTPFFSGFYSKDSIIEAVKLSHLPGAGYAYVAVLVGVFITAFYSFRMYFLVFHGKPRWDQVPHDEHHAHDDHDHAHAPHESPVVVWLPLVLLAIPSVGIGFLEIAPFLYGTYFKGVIFISPLHESMAELAKEFHGPIEMAVESFSHAPFWLALAGVVLSFVFYLQKPEIPAAMARVFAPIYRLFEQKYYFDWFNENVLARGARLLGLGLWQAGDRFVIDGIFVNGSAQVVGVFAGLIRFMQSGRIYHYAFAMLIGVIVPLSALAYMIFTH